ncbi:MAG: type II toxin-antitoxin system PemK/MazF family toxin [Gemmatimonadetes bacterium]|nr:type II toxin-antitoxin system PemK/MazF family toxin [Gemmatimonadota bacterium]
MHNENYIPKRGELVWICARTGDGSNLSSACPAFVLSPGSYNAKVGLAVLCPVGDEAKGYPFEVPIPAGMPASGVILADQLESVTWPSCILEPICSLPAEITEAVLRKAVTLLEREDGP